MADPETPSDAAPPRREEVTALIGNPGPRSRTRAIAEAVAQRVAEATGAAVGDTIDLADHADVLFAYPSETVDALVRRVTESRYLVVATPTYKATYTGLLKAFLDRFDTDGLRGVTAVGVMTGAAPQHSLAVDTTLRSLLVELAASVPTRGLYFLTSAIDRLDEVVDEWADREVVPVLGGPAAGRGVSSGRSGSPVR